MIRNIIKYTLFVFSLLCLFSNNAEANAWRIKVHDAAVVENPIVTLGDIAEPLGNMNANDWNRLKNIQLFAAPEKEGRAYQISKKKLQESLQYVLGDSASYLLLPDSLAIQKNGALMREQDIMRLIQTSLQPYISQLDGDADLSDYRVPAFIFMPTKGQKLEVEFDPNDVHAGRISLRLAIKELDGSTVKRSTASAFLNLWQSVPSPTRPYNRGDRIDVNELTFIRKNLAHINGEVWNGKGGPWQVTRPIGVNEAILASDLAPLAMIRKGQLVDVKYQKGSVTITQQGEALEDAGPGDIIRVRNTHSKKQIFGTVMDSKTVLVQ